MNKLADDIFSIQWIDDSMMKGYARLF